MFYDPEFNGAACTGKHHLFNSQFLKAETKTEYQTRLKAACRLCRRCPVLDYCQHVALTLPKAGRTGIWAGHDIGTTQGFKDLLNAA